MKPIFKIITIFLIIFQLILSSCVNFDSITSTNINKDNKLFSKKSTPDLSVCNSNNFINIGVSKYFIPKGSSESTIITYNIPEKYRAWLELLNQKSPSYPLKFFLIITEKGSSNFKTYKRDLDFGCNSFEWDGKDNNGEYMPEGKYYINIVLSSQYNFYSINERIEQSNNYYNIQNGYFYCDGSLVQGLDKSKNCINFITPDDFAKQITSTTIQISDDPEPIEAGTEFLEVSDVKTLHDLASKLKIDDYNANNLYNSYKTLEGYQSQRISLNDRLSQANISEETRQELTDKIERLDTAINGTNSYISSLKSSVMVQLSTLNNNAINLANHINTVTKTQYITPYPPEDKPDSVGSYFDKAYFADIDISNLLGENGVTLYAPDENDPDQENLKEAWDIDDQRVEILDPSSVFDGSKYIADEIQTAKDLTTDLISGKFTADEEVEVAQTIQQLVSQIKTHTGYLSTKSKRFADDYSENFEKLKEVTAEMHTSLILPLALAMEQVENYSDETFRLKSTNEDQELKRALRTIINKSEFEIKNDTVDAFFDYAYAKAVVVKGYFNKPLPYKEKVISIMLGYSKADWEALKKVDPQGTEELMKATEEIISAFGVPLTVGDLGLVLITPIIKTVKVLSKISSTVLAKGAPADKGKILKSFQGTITKAKEKLTYWFGKYFPKGCLDNVLSIQSLHTLSFNIKAPFKGCPTDIFKNFPVATHLWDLRGKIYKISDFDKFNNKYTELSKALRKIPQSSIPEAGFKTKILQKVVNFKNNGVKIKSYGHPNFNGTGLIGANDNYVLHEFNIIPRLKSLGEIKDNFIKGGNRVADFKAGNMELAKLWFNDTSKYKDVDKLIKELGLVWHHNEDLKTLQLIPSIVHDALKPHAGSVAYVDIIRKNLKKGFDFTTIYFEIFIK